MGKVRDLMFGSLGNGISVCDRNHEVSGDYEKIAHISPARKITFYVELSDTDKKRIEDYASTAKPTVSTSQNDPVFYLNP